MDDVNGVTKEIIPAQDPFVFPGGMVIEQKEQNKWNYRKFYPFTLIKGAGGTGKTFETLWDMGYHNLVFLGHSHKLCAGVKVEYGNIALSSPAPTSGL